MFFCRMCLSIYVFFTQKVLVLLHFRTPHIVIDDSSRKNVAESFTVALTLALGGHKSAIPPKVFMSDLYSEFFCFDT